MPPELARRLIETYTRPGDWILDPMSGIGTTGVEAVHQGRHYVGIELEARFARWQRENLELARRQGAPGRFAVLQGDARRLNEPADAITASGRPPMVDAVITSPPYGDRLRPKRSHASQGLRQLIQKGTFRRDILPGSYGDGTANIGNLGDGAYFEAMAQVYAGCYGILKPGGLLIVVIRPGRDRQRLRPLHHDTARLCVDLGFEFLDEIVAILARVVVTPGQPVQVFAHALFFKRLAIAHLREAGWPVTLEQLEYVLVFQKPALPESTRLTQKQKQPSGRSCGLRSRAAP
jgi:DNA modification methylase